MPAIITITDLNLPELDLFSRYSESQLYHINEPAPGIFIAESPNVIHRALNAWYVRFVSWQTSFIEYI